MTRHRMLWNGPPRPRLARWFAALATLGACAGEPFVPDSDAVVVERLPARPAVGFAALNRSNAVPVEMIPEHVRELIRRARDESDPRYLGQAERLLEPLVNRLPPSPEALVLRGVIRQSRHDFSGALADLDAALRGDPRNAQAWLTKATVHTVRGEYPAARGACVRLAGITDTLTTVTAGAQVASMTGEAVAALGLLRSTMARVTNAPAPIRAWAETLSGEIAGRLGRRDEAAAHLRAALAIEPNDVYALGALADVWLDAGEAGRVVALLRDRVGSDGLRLRLAEAERARGDGDQGAAEIERLRARFAFTRDRGERVHQREEARFRLRLLDDPAGALALARENWTVQREPADIRLLLEAAMAAGDSAGIDTAQRWIATNRFEDVAIERALHGVSR